MFVSSLNPCGLTTPIIEWIYETFPTTFTSLYQDPLDTIYFLELLSIRFCHENGSVLDLENG